MTKTKKPNARSKTSRSSGRLRPGEMDGLVLAFMRKHRSALPLTVNDIAEGIDRSSGAVANCLARLAKRKEARLAKRKPRAYTLPKAS